LIKIKWLITATLTLSMGVGLSDWPPTPQVQADNKKIVSIDWLVPLEEEQERAVEITQEELARIAEVEAKLEADRIAEIAKNTSKMEAALAEVKKYVDKTRYVFSGSSPRGWDCSGLVRWFYLEHFGIELEHSATAQGFAGQEVEMPRPGDIVVYGYSDKDFFHASIYVGDHNVIHSGFNRGDSTEIISLSHPVFDSYTIKFVRIVETN